MPDIGSDHPVPPASGPQQQALLEAAVSRSATVLYVADLGGDRPVRFISSNVESITGHKHLGFINNNQFLYEHIHPDDLAGYDHALEALQDRGALTHEYRFATASGEHIWVRDELRLLDPSATAKQVVGSMTDVTAQKEAETRLRGSERYFRMLLDNNPLPFRLVETESGRILYESPSAVEHTVRMQTADGAKNAEDFYADPKDRQAFLRELRKTGELRNYDLAFRRPDGSKIIVTTNSRRFVHDGKEMHITTIVDLTEERRREAELKQARETLEDAIEALSEGFILFDSEDRMVTCNSQYRDFNRMTQDRLVPGVRWRDLARVRAERGQFVDAVDRVEEWFEEREAERDDVKKNQFQVADGRWFEDAHRRTRQGGLVTTWREITEHKEMEQALRESEGLIRRVLEACPLPVRMWNPQSGEVIYESPAARRMFGRDAHRERQPVRLDIYVDPTEHERYLARLRETDAIDNMEMQLKRKDGSVFWTSVSARCIEYQGEDVVVSSIVDLTELKQREAELQQAREVLEDAIEAMPEGFMLLDADDRLVLCNSRFREFNDLSAEMLTPGVEWLDFVRAGAERGQYMDALGRVEDWIEDRRRYHSLGTGKPGGIEFQQHDGRWYHGFSQATRQGGEVAIRIDITERKKMELALRESEGLIRRVLEACAAPITMSRVRDGVIIYESPAARTLLRYDEPQEGTSALDRWHDPKTRAAFVERLRQTGAVDGLEAQLRKADGELFWCAISSRLIDYRGEEVLVTNAYDLTERHVAEEELARQRELLHQSEKLSALGELLAGVSHELNNPLSVLIGQALLLRETAPDEQTAVRAEKIGKAADRCGRIVKTFLAMARQEPGDTVAVDINNAIENALEMTGYSLRTTGIEVSARLSSNLPAVRADPDQMRQVFINLIVNSQHALQDVTGPRKLHITTSHRKRSGHVAIKVKDNGPGIPPDIRSRIFEPLYTTKEVGTGTGIGLALCHRIIVAHGGTIEVETTAGQGAAFAIRLPVARPETDETAASPKDQSEPALLNVLVVDDERDVGQVISDVLVRDGHVVEVVGSGTAALERIERHRYDVILSDIRMPGMDGPSLYRAVSETVPEQADAMAFVTGDVLSPRVKEFLDESKRPYLEKPIRPRDVRDLVAQLVRLKASRT